MESMGREDDNMRDTGVEGKNMEGENTVPGRAA